MDLTVLRHSTRHIVNICGMKKILTILTGILFILACNSSEERLILGIWKVEEYWVSGNKHPSERFIEFSSDGTYSSFGQELAEVRGEYRIKEDKLILFQPEITDMHGNRVADPFTRIWRITLAPEWLIMEGSPKSQTQDMKLVLRRN